MTDEHISRDREIGRLEGRVGAIERELREDREANKAFYQEVRLALAEIKQTLHESALEDATRHGRFKGGWAVLSAIGAALVAIGGLAINGLKALFS